MRPNLGSCLSEFCGKQEFRLSDMTPGNNPPVIWVRICPQTSEDPQNIPLALLLDLPSSPPATQKDTKASRQALPALTRTV